MDLQIQILAAGVILVAAIIGGYSGCGLAMTPVASLSQVMPPVAVVPVILLLEVMASLWLLPKVWRRVHWLSLTWLFAGMIIGTPLGVYLLAHAPPAPCAS